MTTATGSAITRAPRPSSLADVLDLILDKGLVIDAYVRVSLVGIEILTVDARIVIASVDTYLHYAEAVNRLDLTQTETRGLEGLFQGGLSGNGQSNGQGEDEEDEQQGSSRRPRRDSGRSLAGRLGERGRWDR
jgi:gas vesicle structural protein